MTKFRNKSKLVKIYIIYISKFLYTSYFDRRNISSLSFARKLKWVYTRTGAIFSFKIFQLVPGGNLHEGFKRKFPEISREYVFQ